VVSVVANSEESAASLAKAFGVKRWSTNYQAAVAAPDVDVVDILAPNYLHAPITIAAAEAGKHVICIKPLATSLADAERMLAATAKAGVRLLYAENVPFIPAVREARKQITAGAIGKVFRVKACEGVPGPHASWTLDAEKCGGGALIEMGVHSISFCRTLADADYSTIYAELDTFKWADKITTEDTAVLTLRFTNGVIGYCEDSWSLAGAADSRFEVFGTEGRILIDNLHRQPLQLVSSDDQAAVRPGWSYPSILPGAVLDGHVNMFGHFFDCLRSGAISESEGVVGRDVMAAVEAGYRSARSGKKESIQLAGAH
jgi:predicted dehydrogenase